MNTYKLILSYRGSHYFGWQIQTRDRSVQGELNKVLAKISKSDSIRSIASGRTDAGVHAIHQMVKIDIPLVISSIALLKGLNSLLPLDIRVLHLEPCSETFDPVRDAKSKKYHYLFTCQKDVPPFLIDSITSYPFDLNIELMKRGAKLFEGIHDFSNFYCTGSEIYSTTREIFTCDLTEDQLILPGIHFDCYKFSVRGSGFLKQMVRLMMGALWHLGRGKITLEQLQDAIDNHVGGKVGPTAAPQGLYMLEVSYN